MTLCFSGFTVKILKDFRVITVAREKSILVSLKAIPTGRPAALTNAAIETLPVIPVDVIRPVPTMFFLQFTNFNFIQ